MGKDLSVCFLNAERLLTTFTSGKTVTLLRLSFIPSEKNLFVFGSYFTHMM